MSFSGFFGSQSPAPASPSILGLIETNSPSSSFGSPRRSSMRKKRKQAKLVNPAQSFNFSLKSDSAGFDSYDHSGLDFTGGRFLAELSPDVSPVVSIEHDREPEPEAGYELEEEHEPEPDLAPEPSATNIAGHMSPNLSSNTRSSSPTARAKDGSDSPQSSASPTTLAHMGNSNSKNLNTVTTTPDGTPERGPPTSAFKSLKISLAAKPSPSSQPDTSRTTLLTKLDRARSSSPSSFAADGSPLPKGSTLNSRILSPIDNIMGPSNVSSVSSINKSYASQNRSFSPLGKGSPLAFDKTASLRKPSPLRNGSTPVSDLSGQERSRLMSSGGSAGDVSQSSSPWVRHDTSGSSIELEMSTPERPGSLDRSSSTPGFYAQPLAPGTPDSECEVEHLTQTVTTFEDDDHDHDNFHNTTPDRSATIGPSPRRTMTNNNIGTSPEVPSTPAPRFPYDSLVTPARSSAAFAQTPRSIMRAINTPATGNSVRFNSVAFYKVIERLPEFHASVESPQENLGDEGTAPLGMEPIEKSEVPMVEPSSSDEELDFQPTHHHTLDSIDSDGFDDEVERNTLANSQTAPPPVNGSFLTEDGTTAPYVSDNSLEATTKWLQDFVSEAKREVERTVSDSTQRTVSSSSLSVLDAEEPIRHTSPLNPPCEDEGDISQMENLNNSSEWVVPADLSFGDDTLPRLNGASFSIAAMVDPDATGATTRGITPRRPHGLPAWADVPTINKIASSPEREEEMTPVGPIRARLAASKYISTTPLKHASSNSNSGSASPRLGTSPKTSPPAPFGSSPRRPNSVEDKENLPVLAMSSPVPSPRKTSPSLPSVSEDEELSNEQSEEMAKPKQPLFGSLSRSRPSTFPILGRRPRSRNVFEDTRHEDDEDDDHSETPESPSKPMPDGKAVGSLVGDISKLSLIDMSGNVSGNASKLSFLDKSSGTATASESPRAVSSTSIQSSTSTSRVVSSASGQSATSETSVGSGNSATVLHMTRAGDVIGAQADHVLSLEEELARAYSLIATYRVEVANQSEQLEKLYSLNDDVPRMQDTMKAMRRETKELRAQLLAAQNGQKEMETKLKRVEDERAAMDNRIHAAEDEADELRAHLADAEHAKQELQSEVDALHAAQPSLSAEHLSEELRDKLNFANEELEYAREQLQQSAGEVAHYKEQLAAAENQATRLTEQGAAVERDLQASREECDHLRADLEASRDECKHLSADLDAARTEAEDLRTDLEIARSESGTAASALEEKLLAARQEIAEFKAELRYVNESNSELKAALSEAHDEVDSLRAQLTDTKGVASDAEAELRAARDECASLTSDLESARRDYNHLRADLDEARSQVDHLRSVADQEAHGKNEAQRSMRALEDKAKKAETALADAVAQVHRLEAEREQHERDREHHIRHPEESRDKDRRIKLLEQKLRRLADEREMMNVAVNSAQMETEFYKRRLAAAENAKAPPTRPLRAMKQTPPTAPPASAPRPHRVAT